MQIEPTRRHDQARAPAPDRRYLTRLAGAAVAYALGHHLGLLPEGLGPAPRDTRWADWLDLLLPYLVLGPAGAALAAAGASRGLWTVFAVGAAMYASGHGIHLAANSVANAAPGRTAHLWDEVVGHGIWYLGVCVVIASLAATMVGRARPRNLVAHLLAVAVGVTWATNAVGAGTVVAGLVVAVPFTWFGWRHRDGLPVVLAVAFAPAVALLVAALLRSS